jgi:predicted membrane protein
MAGRKWIIGMILIVLGLLLLGRTLGFMFFSFRQILGYFFPLILIALGLWLLARSRGREQAERATTTAGSPFPEQPSTASGRRTVPNFTPAVDIPNMPPPIKEPTRISATQEPGKGHKARYNKFIGDMFVDCSGIDLQSVEIGSFIGDVEIKLHGGKLAHGLNRMIVSGFIGDIRVLVPEGMAVFCQGSNFIGDIEMMGRRSSGFGNSLDAQTPNYNDAAAKLYIASNHFIGDVRVYIV